MVDKEYVGYLFHRLVASVRLVLRKSVCLEEDSVSGSSPTQKRKPNRFPRRIPWRNSVGGAFVRLRPPVDRTTCRRRQRVPTVLPYVHSGAALPRRHRRHC